MGSRCRRGARPATPAGAHHAPSVEEAAVDLAQPLPTVSPPSYHRVLAVLAGATKPLSARHIAHRAGIADNTALTALDYLATTGVVSRLKCSNVTLHVLDHLHVAREPVLALTHLPDRLAERLATAVAAWQPQPTAVALRLPCPDQLDTKGDDMLDLLVIAGDADGGGWQDAVDRLAADLTRWSGNTVHPFRLTDGDGVDDGELTTAPWRLIAGTPPGALPLTDRPAPEPGPDPPPSLRP
jgi:hypothetical protein